MIKLYEGCNINTIYLSSGKKIELTEDEFEEIIFKEISPIKEKLQEEVKGMLHSIESTLEPLREADSILQKLKEIKQFAKNQNEFDTLVKELEDYIDEADSIIGRYI